MNISVEEYLEQVNDPVELITGEITSMDLNQWYKLTGCCERVLGSKRYNAIMDYPMGESLVAKVVYESMKELCGVGL